MVAILLTISLATMFVGLTMGAGYKANMKAYYPYDAGVAIDAPLEKSSMDSIVSFTEEHCGVEDSVSYYLYAVPEKSIEALSLSDYNHLREILGLSPVVMGNNEFLVHCDTWNYMDGIRQGLKQQPEITLNGRTLTIAVTPILTEPMEQYQNIPGAAGQLPKLTDHHGVPRLEGGGHLLIGRADPASAAVLFPIEFLRPPLMEGFLPVPVLRLRTHANIANNHIKHLFTTWQ